MTPSCAKTRTCRPVFRAIIGVLSGKLSNDNVRLRDYQMERARYEGRIAVLQRRLKGNQSRVLIVDDEAEFRLLVKDALPGFDVVEAENGRQALDVVQEVKLDLVITVIKMPVLDGIKLLATLRAQFPGLKVLAASGYLDADDVCKHPFDGFVGKPLAPEPFQQLVEQTLSLPTG